MVSVPAGSVASSYGKVQSGLANFLLSVFGEFFFYLTDLIVVVVVLVRCYLGESLLLVRLLAMILYGGWGWETMALMALYCKVLTNHLVDLLVGLLGTTVASTQADGAYPKAS